MDLEDYMDECRGLVVDQIRRLVPTRSRTSEILYSRMLEYPLRRAKGLRPALCVATCRALGGRLESALPSAAALELYHNAFLVHDDVEDGSEKRRDEPTLHRKYGVPIAVNVGDAMLALSLQPLLDNMAVVGLSKALRVLDTVARMSRESAEGQAVELEWIHRRTWSPRDADYVRMVYQKTCWYTFIAPIQVGAVLAGAREAQIRALTRFAIALGVAFQIQDDLLNLEDDDRGYGKEALGDLWEGKRTLILMHALRNASPDDRAEAHAILDRARPSSSHDGEHTEIRAALERLEREGQLSTRAKTVLSAALRAPPSTVKSTSDVIFLRSLIEKHDSMHYSRAFARRRVLRAKKTLEELTWIPDSTHRTFLASLADYVVDRTR